ncbi:hypothetical protein SAMN02799622_04007 [Methylobacterium sp. UNC378MF]|uniref:hypothetical protein n=1 Tax=unclassified Methylobacterium TaxID=2615210 RepID=UPI000880927E|nr:MULTISPECIES: hypothetical protein [unclassified Methylobacterium]SDA27407.1 hypothetical protein SAMN02799622_04007 [Methylobacterium sp. UNC378MF]
MLVVLVFAALTGGAIGFALALPQGILVALLAAQAAAALSVGLVAVLVLARRR